MHFKKINIQLLSVPIRWIIHGIFFHRLIQVFFPNFIEKTINKIAKKEFENLSGKTLNNKTRKIKIIVSLTTYSPRLSQIHLVISRLMQQTLKPDKIILYYSDTEELLITEELHKLIDLGLEIRFVKDIRSHKKYYFAFQDFPDAIVITVDDDTIYSKKLIQTLFNSYVKYPKCISAGIVVNYKKIGGVVQSSTTWRQKFFYGIGDERSIAYGVGGVLYPPNCMPKELFDIEKIRAYAPYTDDLWLKAIEQSSGVSVVKARHSDKLFGFFVSTINSQEIALANINDKKDRNLDSLNMLLPIYWRK
ncbi:glycosyltransferase [Lactococcus cremoris]|uniref:glycosyltransferase n=1 Tax=Lactococcus lactis subsp. cremoris TaxID=1359 RepID=UPI000E09DBBE|nr:glycosyltransferase [Lactococcus cremoris]RDG24123.1 glycosyltransferase [Lactococcus cremoris]